MIGIKVKKKESNLLVLIKSRQKRSPNDVTKVFILFFYFHFFLQNFVINLELRNFDRYYTIRMGVEFTSIMVVDQSHHSFSLACSSDEHRIIVHISWQNNLVFSLNDQNRTISNCFICFVLLGMGWRGTP